VGCGNWGVGCVVFGVFSGGCDWRCEWGVGGTTHRCTRGDKKGRLEIRTGCGDCEGGGRNREMECIARTTKTAGWHG